jgi:hypothetical protein
VTIDQNQVSDSGDGGGIYTMAPVDVTDGTDISHNSAGEGGGVYLKIPGGSTCSAPALTPAPPAVISPAEACFDDTTINDNGATGSTSSNGGGVADIEGSALFTNGTISTNHLNAASSEASGAGIAQGDSSSLLEMVNESVDDNTILTGSPIQVGAGVSMFDGTSADIYESNISNNVIQYTSHDEATGAGIASGSPSTLNRPMTPSVATPAPTKVAALSTTVR